MQPDKSLKDSNSPALRVYLLTHAVFIGWVVLEFPVTFDQVGQLGSIEWVKAFALFAMGLPATILNGLLGSENKARLVFWRYRHPYPGSQAFSKLAPSEPRVDLNRLRAAVGGTLPSDPKEQNVAWYRLSLQHGNDPRVASSHKEFLLLRDIAWLSLLCGLVGPCLIVALAGRAYCQTAAWYALTCLGLYMAIRIAAVVTGKRFVRNVLACAAGAIEPPTSSIVTG